MIGRHYLSQHSGEHEVARIHALPVKSKERKRQFDLLRLRGNFYHNEKVLQTESGEIILLRRPQSSSLCDIDDYGPCPQCLGYVSKNDLWRHARYRCIAKDVGKRERNVDGKRNQIRMESDILMKRFDGASEKLKKTVLGTMKRDEIFGILSHDPLILEYGNQTLRNQANRKNLVSQKMRSVAGVVMELRKLEPAGGDYISDFLKPSKFDMIMKAVQTKCTSVEVENDSNDAFKFPSVAIKSGHDLVWLARIKRSQAIRHSDATAEEEANRYLQLHQAEWHAKMSSLAAATLNNRKCQKVTILPSTADLKKVSEHTVAQIKSLMKTFDLSHDYRDYRLLQKTTLVRLIIFNKRRPGEMSKLLLSAITERPEWEKCQVAEVSERLNSLEKQLAKRFQLVKIKGKRGRAVPVIIPPECSKALQVIIDHRQTSGIPQCNPYIFARNTSSSCLDGGECITDVIAELDLECPEAIKTTKMRKYAATVSQILSLGTREVEWLADHLGHDVSVHTQYYRLQESTIELCKVSKILLAMDSGVVGKWVGKKLDDIDVDGRNL